MTTTPGARAFVQLVSDPDSFRSWDSAPQRTALSADYRQTLERAAARSGTDESVITGQATVGHRPVAMIVSEFAFLGGSIGIATADRITAAVRRATASGLPLLAAPASGGTRMQEGTPAFVRMITIARAVEDHKAAGLPYLVYLRHPTTGGVLASWASLGQVLLAEPQALIGFLGPAVVEGLTGRPMPAGVQTAENLVSRGLVDQVVPRDQLAGVVGRVLSLTADPRPPSGCGPEVGPASGSSADAGDAWAAVAVTRSEDRPGVRDLLTQAGTGTVALHDRPDSALVVALTRLAGTACVLVGQDRAAAAAGGRFGPVELRRTRRAVGMAEALRLPVVCVIDTPGADLSREAEDGGLAAEIAHCLADLMALTVPTVSLLLGQGTGGAALALLPARRVVAAQHAWLAPLPPEGASLIMHHTTGHAAEFARRQRIRAADLLADGLVHVVVPERPSRFCLDLADACAREIAGQLGSSGPRAEIVHG